LTGRTQAVEIENLAQRHVERADAAADGRGERSFDGDAQVARGVDALIRQPGVELAIGLFAGKDFKPLDGALAAVGLFDGGVEDPLRGLPDVAAGAVAFDERDDRVVGNVNCPFVYSIGAPSAGKASPL
jgi:hypothetical protein